MGPFTNATSYSTEFCLNSARSQRYGTARRTNFSSTPTFPRLVLEECRVSRLQASVESHLSVSRIQTLFFLTVLALCYATDQHRRYKWPRGLRRWSMAYRLLRLWVRIPPGAWMSVVSVVSQRFPTCAPRSPRGSAAAPGK